ncbi:MAG: hypothetical protein DRJ32_03370 [Thermoprotei archaeon]|nr:MAG: hypothetical protein DRJ32_03370 [Thermoprotei archaeon]
MAYYGNDLDVIYSIIEVEGVLYNKYPLRVGSGKEELLGPVDQPIVRIAGEPVIPGSSLKGVFRSYLERIARSSGLPVCDPFSDEDKRREDEEGPCIICQIFGGGGVRDKRVGSHVVFFDATPIGEAKVTYITRSAIDRFRGGSRTGALFRVEVVEPGCEWSFKSLIYNIDIIDCQPIPGVNDPYFKQKVRLLRLLFATLAKRGIQVGGIRSTGYGLILLKPERTIVRKFKVEDLKLKEVFSGKLSDIMGGWSV